MRCLKAVLGVHLEMTPRALIGTESVIFHQTSSSNRCQPLRPTFATPAPQVRCISSHAASQISNRPLKRSIRSCSKSQTKATMQSTNKRPRRSFCTSTSRSSRMRSRARNNSSDSRCIKRWLISRRGVEEAVLGSSQITESGAHLWAAKGCLQ